MRITHNLVKNTLNVLTVGSLVASGLCFSWGHLAIFTILVISAATFQSLRLLMENNYIPLLTSKTPENQDGSPDPSSITTSSSPSNRTSRAAVNSTPFDELPDELIVVIFNFALRTDRKIEERDPTHQLLEKVNIMRSLCLTSRRFKQIFLSNEIFLPYFYLNKGLSSFRKLSSNQSPIYYINRPIRYRKTSARGDSALLSNTCRAAKIFYNALRVMAEGYSNIQYASLPKVKNPDTDKIERIPAFEKYQIIYPYAKSLIYKSQFLAIETMSRISDKDLELYAEVKLCSEAIFCLIKGEFPSEEDFKSIPVLHDFFPM